MAVGGSEYSVLLKAVIQKLTQAEIDAQTKGLKINLDVNLVGVGAVAEQIDKIKKSTSGGGIYAGEGFTDAADKMAIMSAEVEKIRSNFAGLGENVTVTKIFDDEKIRKYSVSVDKIANGLKTVDRYTVDIGEDGQQIITNAKSTEKAFDSIATKQKKLTDLSEKYKLQLESLKTVHADAFGKGDTSIEESERKYLNLIDSFKKGNATTQEVSNAFIDLKNKVKDVENGFDSSRAHTDAFTTAISKNIMKVFQWAIATTAIYGSLRKIEEGVEYVTALNAEMTNVQIVTGNTSEEINRLSGEYNKLAKELGVTTLEVAKGNLEWIRQGKSVEDSSELLRASVMLAKLANLDQAESTEYLTSVINGYKLSIDEVMPTIDKLIALDNSYASSAGEVSAALQKTASTAKQAGVSFDQLAAMITVVSDVSRIAPETIGNAFKTILTRMQNVKIGAFFDEEGQSISDVEKVLTGLGITLRDETTKQFRNMGTVLEETMQLWNKLGKEGKTVEQSMLANAFAGKMYARIYSNV